MRSRRQQQWLRSRAALAILLVALGWLAVPVSLAAQKSDVCEMECCVADGHCCCAAHRTYVAGQIPDGGDIVTVPELFAPCPAKCASAATSFSTVARLIEQPRAPALRLSPVTDANFARASFFHSHPELSSATARGSLDSTKPIANAASARSFSRCLPTRSAQRR